MEFNQLPVRERMRLILEKARESGDAEVLRELEAAERLLRENPLQDFEPHSDSQRDFFEARTKVVAAFAGNRFGKTTSLVVRSLIDCVDRDCLPGRLRPYKSFDAPVHGWIVCPTTDKMYDSLIPAFQKWCPQAQLLGGQWAGSKGGAWSKERRMITFRNGSTLSFKTYEQHESTLGGADLHFVGYDEPPPLRHREECATRLAGHDASYEMFAMTPLKTNTGWIRREIFKQREAPDITVIRGSMHDNPTLAKGTVEWLLNSVYSNDLWRRAREFGDFVDVGGLIYPDFDRCVLREPFPLDFIRSLDVVVGIDPGIRNCGLVWVGFDGELVAHVFHEELLQDRTAADYAKTIRDVNGRLGLRDVQYVIDPAAKQRAQANGMTVLSEINKAGIYPNLGQNDHELGFGQMRVRMQQARFRVSPECRLLRDQADDYAAKEPEEGRDDSHLEPIRGNDHLLDALRYAVMERFWDPVMESEAPKRQLGFEAGRAPDLRGFSFPGGSEAPMGAMS